MAKETEQQKQQLNTLTDYVQQLEMNKQVENDLQQAMERLATSFKTWEEENKINLGAVVNSEHANIIIEQMDVPLESAEDALRRSEGDLNKALVYLINK